MSPKDLIIDFLNLIFLIGLVALIIFYFIVGDRFSTFVEIMKSLVPLSFFVLMFLIVMKIKRAQLKRAKKEGEDDLEIVLRLTFLDKIKADAVTFIIPVVILGIAFLINETIIFSDVIEATVVFLIIYLWNKYLFGKAEN